MKPKLQPIIYTILVDEMALAAFEATATEARELLKERWFFMELSELKVAGEPVYNSGARLRVRPATEDEWAAYEPGMRKRRGHRRFCLGLFGRPGPRPE